MARVGVPYFTNTVTASPAGATEIVIATLDGCYVRYPSDHFILSARADITVEASVTGITLKLRRSSLTGTLIATSVFTPKAAADFVRCSVGIDASDAPGDVANLTYVLTATMTAAGGASTVNLVSLGATLTS